MKPVIEQHMEDTSLRELREAVDMGNPFLVDCLTGKSNEEIEKILDNLDRTLQNYIMLHKDTHEIKKDINCVKSFLALKTIKEQDKKLKNKEVDDSDGYTLI